MFSRAECVNCYIVLYFMKVLVRANLWCFLVGQFFCMELGRCLFDSLGI